MLSIFAIWITNISASLVVFTYRISYDYE